jgi:hypothetical protein
VVSPSWAAAQEFGVMSRETKSMREPPVEQVENISVVKIYVVWNEIIDSEMLAFA